MSDVSSKQVPLWSVVAAAAATVLAVTVVTLAVRKPVASSGSAAPAPDPIHVPRWVDPALVRHQPRFHFTFDSPEALAELRASEKLDEVVAGAANDLDLFRKLDSWTRAQFEPGIPDPYPPIDARIILRDVRSGFTGGFCAQYNYVLAQALMSFGYPARYVTVQGHEVMEAWLKDERRWVCLDPLHGATYVDESGRALSVLEIVSRLRDGKPLLAGPGSRPETVEQVAPTFTSFAVWIKNDHVSHPVNFTDLEQYKVYFLFDGQTAPHGALATSSPEDLYVDPEAFTAQASAASPAQRAPATHGG
jgi:hypothetical protein